MKLLEILLAIAADGQSLRGAHARFDEDVTIGSKVFSRGTAVPVALTDDSSGRPQLSALLGDALAAAIAGKSDAEYQLSVFKKQAENQISTANQRADEATKALTQYQSAVEGLKQQAVAIYQTGGNHEARAAAYDALAEPLALTAEEKAIADAKAESDAAAAKLAGLLAKQGGK